MNYVSLWTKTEEPLFVGVFTFERDIDDIVILTASPSTYIVRALERCDPFVEMAWGASDKRDNIPFRLHPYRITDVFFPDTDSLLRPFEDGRSVDISWLDKITLIMKEELHVSGHAKSSGSYTHVRYEEV